MPYEYETSPEYAQLRLSEAINKLRSNPQIEEINDPEKLYAIGMGFIKDMEGFNLNGVHPECDPYFEKAANMGHLAAQKQLGKGYTTYNYSEEYYNKAKHWMAKAAAQGDEEAIQLLNKIISKITEYATLLPRAEQGDIAAQIKYAKYLKENYQLEDRKNVYEQAEIWLRKAVAQGSAEAEYELANLLIEILGYEGNKSDSSSAKPRAGLKKEIKKLLENVAHKGHTLAAKAAASRYGDKVMVDKAIELSQVAANAGDVASMMYLAEAYGKKAARDSSFRANETLWLKRAAEAGDTQAKWKLEQESNQQDQLNQPVKVSVVLINKTRRSLRQPDLLTDSIIKNEEAGSYGTLVDLYQKKIERDKVDGETSYNLGILHIRGLGTPINYEAASAYFKDAGRFAGEETKMRANARLLELDEIAKGSSPQEALETGKRKEDQLFRDYNEWYALPENRH